MAEAERIQNGAGLSDVLRGMWRRKWFVLATWLLGSLLGYALVKVVEPSYQTEAQILIGAQETPNSQPAGAEPTAPRLVDQREVLSELAVLQSNDLAQRVIEQLQLTKNPAYNPKLKSLGQVKNIAIQLGFSDDPAKLTDGQLALKQYADSASIYQVPESNVIGIKYTSANAENAAEVANAIAENYVRSTQELQATNSTGTREWLSRQITDLRRKVSTAEAEVERFRAEQGLLRGQSATLGVQEISELNSQITLADAAEDEAMARAREIKDLLASKGSVDTSSDVLNSSTVAALREQQLSATRKISELSATYLDGHPKMIAARKELRDVEGQLRREALKVVGSLEGQAKIAKSRAAALRSKLGKLKEREGEANIDDVKLKSLEREAAADRNLLEQLLGRYADANANNDVSVKKPLARIIQRAAVPASIYFPKAGPLVLLTSLTGLLLGLGLAFLASMMRLAGQPATAQSHTVSMQTVENALAERPPAPRQPSFAPTPGQMKPTLPPSATRPVAPMPKARPISSPQAPIAPPAVENERAVTTTADTASQLAVSLIKLKDDFGIFSSRFAGQTRFKTDVALFAVATARAIAAQKKKVLVIDADSNSHALEPLFDLEQGVGLSDLVEGQADFTKIIRRDQQSTAHIISYGMSNQPATATALENRMPSIINSLEDVYDIVLVHAGDSVPSSSSALLGCKSVIMIVPQNEQRDLAVAEQSLHDLGAESVMHVTLLQETILT